MPEERVGIVSHFFAQPVVAGIEVTSVLSVGDTIHIKGNTTDMTVPVESIQYNNLSIQEAKPGQAVGIKVVDRVRPGDEVYKIT